MNAILQPYLARHVILTDPAFIKTRVIALYVLNDKRSGSSGDVNESPGREIIAGKMSGPLERSCSCIQTV